MSKPSPAKPRSATARSSGRPTWPRPMTPIVAARSRNRTASASTLTGRSAGPLRGPREAVALALIDTDSDRAALFLAVPRLRHRLDHVEELAACPLVGDRVIGANQLDRLRALQALARLQLAQVRLAP